MGITPTASAAADNEEFLTIGENFAHQSLFGKDNDTEWYRYEYVFAVFSVLLLAFTVLTFSGTVVWPDFQVIKRRQILAADEKNRSAAPAITAIGSSPGNVFLAPKRNTAVTTCSGLNINRRFVNEFHVFKYNDYDGEVNRTAARLRSYYIDAKGS
jgi:hypothetical protein